MPSVILLPGLASDATLWRDQLPALAARHPVVVSDVHFRFDTLPEMAAALWAEHPGGQVLVGSSMGGMLALEAWRQAPHRVRGLALLGSTARPDTPELMRLRCDAIALFAAGRMDEVLRANLPLAIHHGGAVRRSATARRTAPARGAANETSVGANHADIVATYLTMVRHAGAAALIRQNRAVMARADARPWLPGITCPTLVMCGVSDLLTPPDCSREIAAAVLGARLELLADCGHLLTLEQPARVNALLLDWLATVDANLSV